MIHHQVPQGSEAWRKLRAGLPTSSRFDKVITKTGKKTDSAGRRTFMSQLLTEKMIGHPLDDFSSAAMNHGTDYEAEAVASWSFEYAKDTELCGIFTDDAGRFGASPDRLIDGGKEGLEIKCPMNPVNHVNHLLYPEEFEKEHIQQVQGQIYVVGFERVYLVSYYHGMPLSVVVCEPNPKFQETLGEALKEFTDELAQRLEAAKANGWLPEPEPEQADSLGVSDEDVEAILAAKGK